MPYPIPNSLQTYALAGLVVLITGLPVGNPTSSFAETTMDADIVMTIDKIENFGDETKMFNDALNVFTVAFLLAGGNLEVVVIDRNAICNSALTDSGNCSDQNLSQYRHVKTVVEGNDAVMTIRSAYDQ